jgi:class 3 adenylate cyclase
MKAPPIQYTTTSDGVAIAYFRVGRGQPIVVMDLVVSNVALEWGHPATPTNYGLISQAYTIVRYDHRGFGQSDRDIDDFSLPVLLRDLEAVINNLDLRDVILVAGRGITSPLALAYAAKHPERLSHLVLVGGLTRLPETFKERIMAILAVPGADYEFVSENLGRLIRGWEEHEASHAEAEIVRESLSFEKFREFWHYLGEWDAAEFLRDVITPTLLVQSKGHQDFGPEPAREIAAQLRDARIALVDSPTAKGRAAQSADLIAQFIGAPVRPPGASPTSSTGTAIVLFADIADSTALTERLGDRAFRDKARELDDALRRIIRDHSGIAIDGKLVGDGVMAVFTSARQAIEAALACGRAGGELELHLGIHAGDVIREEGNVFGGAVNIAARISGLSAPGELLVSQTVRDLARTSAGVTFVDRGEQQMKGIDVPVRVYEVSWRAS